jgi:hypothetical protein
MGNRSVGISGGPQSDPCRRPTGRIESSWRKMFRGGWGRSSRGWDCTRGSSRSGPKGSGVSPCEQETQAARASSHFPRGRLPTAQRCRAGGGVARGAPADRHAVGEAGRGFVAMEKMSRSCGVARACRSGPRAVRRPPAFARHKGQWDAYRERESVHPLAYLIIHGVAPVPRFPSVPDRVAATARRAPVAPSPAPPPPGLRSTHPGPSRRAVAR